MKFRVGGIRTSYTENFIIFLPIRRIQQRMGKEVGRGRGKEGGGLDEWDLLT